MTGKLFVVHDELGRIKATAVSTNESAAVRAPHGLRVHVTDHPNLDRKEMGRYLVDLHLNHVVELLAAPRIVAKRTRNTEKRG